jgi:hypothetical protein
MHTDSIYMQTMLFTIYTFYNIQDGFLSYVLRPMYLICANSQDPILICIVAV